MFKTSFFLFFLLSLLQSDANAFSLSSLLGQKEELGIFYSLGATLAEVKADGKFSGCREGDYLPPSAENLRESKDMKSFSCSGYPDIEALHLIFLSDRLAMIKAEFCVDLPRCVTTFLVSESHQIKGEASYRRMSERCAELVRSPKILGVRKNEEIHISRQSEFYAKQEVKNVCILDTVIGTDHDRTFLMTALIFDRDATVRAYKALSAEYGKKVKRESGDLQF